MKKVKIILIFILLMFPLLSAVNINMKEQFSQGETLMATISGNFLEPPSKESIFFYRGHVKIPLEYDIVKIDEEYYLYALLGDKQPNNYSIRIEDVRYMQGTQVSEEPLVKNFTITELIADFSINPGFVITEEDFFIQTYNLQDFEIVINIDENKTEGVQGFFASLFGEDTTRDKSVTLKPGEMKNIEFELGNVTDFRKISLSTENLGYEIPVYAFVRETKIEEEQNKSEENMAELENETGLEESESEFFEENKTKDEIKTASTKTCSELNGTICGKNERCSGETENARDAVCCLGTCEEIKKSNTGKIIGWMILVAVLVFIIWFFKKKSKTKRKVNILNIAKGKK